MPTVPKSVNADPQLDFPEQLFPVAAGRTDDYYKRVQNGLLRLKETRVVICGLARNIASVAQLTAGRVERLGTMCRNYRVVIYENDSSDSTRIALNGWAFQNQNVQIEGQDRGDPVNPQTRCLQRTARMAIYRNQLRSRVVELYGDWATHVIVIDTDLPGGWSFNGIAHTFGHLDWDFVGANGVKFQDYGGEPNKQLYFDVWAFRHAGSDTPCKPTEINPRKWNKGEPMLPVNSCFGGLGCYRMDAFKRCAYDGSDCEHVPFHRRMRENGMGRLFMNPSQLTLY